MALINPAVTAARKIRTSLKRDIIIFWMKLQRCEKQGRRTKHQEKGESDQSQLAVKNK